MEAVIEKKQSLKRLFLKVKESRWTNRLMPILFLVVTVVIFSVLTNGKFLAIRNLTTVFDQALIVATVATGAAFIFATGNVNIAMGACTALTATVAALVYNATQSVFLMFAVSIGFGVVLLALCALLSTIFKVKVMFVTIVMMVLLSSIQQVLLGGSTLNLDFAMTNELKQAKAPYIIFFIFFALCIVIFHFTSVGRSIKMVGSNELCASQTGIFKNKYLLIAFTIAGVGVGLGALLMLIRTASVATTSGGSLNMDCMLAIVLGGMPVFGGSKSRAYAAFIGAITVTVLNSGLLMIGVSATILQGVRGVIFLLLVLSSHKRPEGLPTREG